MASPEILIVDDEPNVLNLAALVLQDCGHPVLTSSNGLEGLETFEERKDSIAVLLTDVQMPIMDGIEMAKSIKARKKEVKVIFISGYAPTDEITDLILAWDAQFLAKPFDIKSLRSTVLKAIAGS